jgi:hypothetical protein
LVVPQLPEHIGKRLERQAEKKLLQALEIRKVLERLARMSHQVRDSKVGRHLRGMG